MPRSPKLPLGMYKRGQVYHARFRSNGSLIRKSLSPDFRVACDMLSDLRLKTYLRQEGVIGSDVSLDSLIQDWLSAIRQALRPSSVRRYRQNLDNIQRLISVRLVSQLSLEVVEVFRADRIREGVTHQTINKDVAALRTMLNWAVGRKRIGSNPLRTITNLPEEPKQARALLPEEVHRLLETSTPHYRDIWYAYLATGLRKMELANLLFSDIDWDGREIVVRAQSAKNRRERRIPIDGKLFAILRREFEKAETRVARPRAGKLTTRKISERLTHEHAFVTTSNTPIGGNIYRQFIADCSKAGIETKTVDATGRVVEFVDLHSTRHTFATDLITNGVDPKTVQTLLGHQSLEMTMKIYTKIAVHHKWTAIGRLSYGAGEPELPNVIPLSNTG